MKGILTVFISLIFFISGFSQKADSTIIYWSEARALTVSDFTIIADSSSKIKGNNLALTRTGITYALTSKPASKSFDIRIFATMHRANSFIKERALDAPVSAIEYLMNHEEKHFDISEIFAREAVRALRTGRFTRNHAKEIGILMRRIFAQSEAMQALYDKETSNGSNALAQQEWNVKIAERLKSLGTYKNKSLEKRFQ